MPGETESQGLFMVEFKGNIAQALCSGCGHEVKPHNCRMEGLFFKTHDKGAFSMPMQSLSDAYRALSRIQINVRLFLKIALFIQRTVTYIFQKIRKLYS